MRLNPCLELYEILKKRIEVAISAPRSGPGFGPIALRLFLPETRRPKIHFFETLPDMTKLTI
ncbi:hypothetical protein ASE36_04260 [Rhizobium sp. Root274]|nr:hypothetical protein ASC71_04265 [Rhizobium sp. Root1240]KRD33011.1 hypothetical protein ASE36_04260 [Rhizobium sp. Root274]